MKNVLRIVAVVLPLACSATLAVAQANPDQGVVSGSENSIREVIGEPQLKDDGGFREEHTRPVPRFREFRENR